jgi:hypothetical protein
MAYPSAARTWAAAEKITAARLNDIRDHLTALRQPPFVQAYDGAGVACANATSTLITFDSEANDNGATYDGALHSTSSNTSRINLTTPGVWAISAYYALPSATYTAQVLNLRMNAAGSSSGGTSLRSAPFDPLQAPRLLLVREYTSASDYVEMFVSQTSGASRTTSTGNNVTGISAWLLSAT